MRLFQSIKIGRMELRNRIVMPAMHLLYTPDGEVNDQLIDFYEERARGGAGLILVGGCAIDEAGGGPGMIRLDHPRYLEGLLKLTTALQAQGAKVGAQLYQAGRYSHSALTGTKPVAPSPIASRLTGEKPAELTREGIAGIIDSFVNGAILAKEAGFDTVEILGSAGYLISQFLSPLTNKREDEYGGSWENRLRFPLQVVNKVIAALGPDFPVLVRVAGNDFVGGSNTNREAVAFCQELEKAGVAGINVTGGWHETRVPQLTTNVPEGAFVYLANSIKQQVSVPVIACNRINDPLLAEKVLATGQADLIGVARGFLADPEWSNKASRGANRAIRPCIGCNQGCLDNVFSGRQVTCLANPRAGRERATELTKVKNKKKILIIGGGAAGMTAASTLAQRGHDVSLWEQGSQLGGQLSLAGIPPGRRDFQRLVDYLIAQLGLLNVKVHLNKQASPGKIAKEEFDEVIVATGGVEAMPTIFQNTKHQQVVSSWDILQGKEIAGQQVVIVGGGPTGVETALFLGAEAALTAEQFYFLSWYQGEEPAQLADLLYQTNRKITIVEKENRIGTGLGQSTRWSMLSDLKRFGIRTIKGQEILEIDTDQVLVGNEERSQWLPAETIVIATGTVANNSLYQELIDANVKCHVVGDAHYPRGAQEAIQGAFDLALSL